MDTQPSLEEVVQGRQLEAVIIGASAGGVSALLQLLPSLPAGYTLPVVVVLHVMPGRPSQLAEVFQQRMEMKVVEAGDKDELIPGTLYFAPAGYHLLVEAEGTVALSCDPPLHFARPSIDVAMESAADAYGPELVGILLTGANDDGARGLAAIGGAGGLTVAQDPADAEVDVMPRRAIEIRKPDLVLSLAEIRRLLLMLEKSDGE
jgi:two-component system chemotaxis response regulator CheB